MKYLVSGTGKRVVWASEKLASLPKITMYSDLDCNFSFDIPQIDKTIRLELSRDECISLYKDLYEYLSETKPKKKNTKK